MRVSQQTMLDRTTRMVSWPKKAKCRRSDFRVTLGSGPVESSLGAKCKVYQCQSPCLGALVVLTFASTGKLPLSSTTRPRSKYALWARERSQVRPLLYLTMRILIDPPKHLDHRLRRDHINSSSASGKGST